MYGNKPVIGLTGSFMQYKNAPIHNLGQSYLHAVRHFGGIPLFIPVLAEEEELSWLISRCDGLILTGGVDIDPQRFGETVLNDTVAISPERDESEHRVLELAVERNIPILGICRGIQMLNVYFGGSLYQDIPAQVDTEIRHAMQMPYHRTCHNCTVVQGSALHRLLSRDVIAVNSHHHQSVKVPAPGFEVMARSEDGIIEAICHREKEFCWGVQWHPERIWDIEPSSADIFRAFIAACKK